MKVNTFKFFLYLYKNKINQKEFMDKVQFDDKVTINNLIYFDIPDRENAEKFIKAVGAEDAYNLIDWEAMHVKKPSRRKIFAYAY